MLGRAVVLATSHSAHAEDLVYAAPSDCPPEARVEQRFEDARPARVGAPGARRVTIERTARGFAGTLDVDGSDRSGSLSRTVEAATCHGVVEALAVVLAVHARLPEKQTNSPAENDARDPGAADLEENDAPVPARPVRAPESPAPERRQDAPSAEARRLRVAAGAGASVMTFIEGNVLPSGLVFVDVTGPEVVGHIRPAVGLSAGLSSDVERRFDGGVARFRLAAVALDACPIGLDLAGGVVTLSACARSEIGALSASATLDPTPSALTSRGVGGTLVRTEGDTSALWAAAGGRARLRLMLPRTGGFRPLLEVGAGGVAALTRDRFLVPSSAVTLPPVSFTSSIALGVAL